MHSDFTTIDGRPGATGATPKGVKMATSLRALFALHQARVFLDQENAESVHRLSVQDLCITDSMSSDHTQIEYV